MRALTVLSLVFLLSLARTFAFAIGPASLSSHDALEVAEDLSLQIDAPLEVFGNTLSETMEARHIAMRAVTDEIRKAETAGCRLDGVRDHVMAQDAFLSSAMLISGAKSISDMRLELKNKGTFFKVTFSSSTPPDPTEQVIPLVKSAGEKIKILTTTFNLACAEIQEARKSLSPSDTARMEAQTAELQRKNEALSLRVKQIVDELNQQASAIDTSLLDWAAQSLRNAHPQEGPAAQD